MSEMLSFDRRLKRIGKSHERMARRGRVFFQTRDGLIKSRARRIRPRLPLRGLMLVALALFGFKVFLFLNYGPAEYEARLDILRSGTLLEQGGAFVMQADPVTVMIATELRTFFS